tara:strand:+ start:570 stop:824 length:255 start_codon:yes stop_codon:yes gene_type:complete
MSIQELREALKTETIFFGTNSTIKNLKNGKLKVVMVSKNCNSKTLEDIEYYAKIGKVKVIKLNQPSDEIALICKKAYPISVLSY